MKTNPKNQKRVQGSRLHPEQASQNNNPKPAQPASFTPRRGILGGSRPDSDTQGRMIICSDDGENEVCSFVHRDEDAQLIAAAPELFLAVQFAAEEIAGILADEIAMLDDMTEGQLPRCSPCSSVHWQWPEGRQSMNNAKTPEESDGSPCTIHGDSAVFRYWAGISFFTDGVKYLADEARCYWFWTQSVLIKRSLPRTPTTGSMNCNSGR